MVAVVAPLLHEYETMVLLAQAVAVAVNVDEDALQLIGPLLEAVTVGVQTLEVTTVLAVAVQPLDWVTVTVYVPAVETVVVAVVAPLLHEYEEIVFDAQGVAVAVKVAEAAVHVIGPSFEAVTVGVQILVATVVVAEDVQPFVCVTVTVYTPGAEADVVAVVAPLLHRYADIVFLRQAVALAFSVTEVVEQVIGPVLEGVKLGKQTSEVTVVLATAVQPLDWVTVTE